MDTYYLRVFPKTHGCLSSVFLTPTKPSLMNGQSIAPPSTSSPHRWKTVYVKIAPSLSTLGQSLYEWMDGPTQRWLESLARHIPRAWPSISMLTSDFGICPGS